MRTEAEKKLRLIELVLRMWGRNFIDDHDAIGAIMSISAGAPFADKDITVWAEGKAGQSDIVEAARGLLGIKGV